MSCLLKAVSDNCVALVQSQLERGACMDIRDSYGDGLLHISCCNNNSEIVRLLVESGCDVNQLNASGDPPLHFAIRNGNISLIEMLIETGADMKIKNEKGQNCLHFAVERCNIEIVKLLLDNGAEVQEVDNMGLSPLHYTTRKGKGSKAQMENTKYIMAILLDAKANVNLQDNEGYTPLIHAIKNSNVEVARLLLQRGASVNGDVNGLPLQTPIYQAIFSGDEAMISLLLNRGINVNEPNNVGETPFHLILLSDIQVVQLFLKHGADLRLRDKFGTSAAHFAAMNDNVDVLKLVLETGFVSIQDRTFDGLTPLHVAARLCAKNCVQFLVEMGVDINCTANNGNTPIFEAIIGCSNPKSVDKHIDCMLLLLELGADVNHVNRYGKTILNLVIEKADTTMINVIIEYLADLQKNNVNISDHNRQVIKNHETLEDYFNKCLIRIQRK